MKREKRDRRMSFFGPTVMCHIKDDPYLLCRSYTSLYKDAMGKFIIVHDGLGKSRSQAKRRRLARRRNQLCK